MTNRPFASRTCAVIDARGKVTIRSERQTQCPNRVKSCPDGPEVRLQLYPRKRTQLGHHAMSEKCQQRKWSLHSITSFAVTSNPAGMLTPSALAVFILITKSYFVGCSTGRSAVGG